MLYFLEKLGLLLEADMLNVEATRKLFAGTLRPYGKVVRAFLQKEADRGNERGERWTVLLTNIDHQVLRILGIANAG